MVGDGSDGFIIEVGIVVVGDDAGCWIVTGGVGGPVPAVL